MKTLLKLFVRGLAAILPVALTGWLVWAAVRAVETLLRSVITAVLGEESYWTGMGFALSIPLVLLVGLLMYSFVVRAIYSRITGLLARIPVVKTVYGMVADVVRLFASSEQKPFRKVVVVTVGSGKELLGFLTREDFDDMPSMGAGKIAVYLPMSYQLGGFTVLVDRGQVREVDLGIEEALRFCITAGVSRTVKGPKAAAIAATA